MEKSRKKAILFIVTYAILLFFAIYKWQELGRFLGIILGIAFPFILGACMAFILSVPMNAIEKRLLGRMKNPKLIKLKRPFAMVLTFLLLGAAVWFFFAMVVPEFGRTLGRLVDSMPQHIANVKRFFDEKSEQLSPLGNAMAGMNLDEMINSVVKFAQQFFVSFFSSTFTVIGSVVQAVINTAIGAVFAAYILFSKEKLSVQFQKMLYAFLPERAALRIVGIGRLTHRTFAGFLTGQCMEGVILGFMFFIALTLFRMPYAMLIGVVIAVTALIPVFGAFVGCFFGAFLIFMVNPMQALAFVVLFLVLQQIDGNLVYPRVVGNSVGLPSIWVLVAVTVGGELMGVVGMLLFIPLSSVLYALLRDAVNRRLERKGMSGGA